MSLENLEGEFLLFPYRDRIIFGRGFKLFNMDISNLYSPTFSRKIRIKEKT